MMAVSRQSTSGHDGAAENDAEDSDGNDVDEDAREEVMDSNICHIASFEGILFDKETFSTLFNKTERDLSPDTAPCNSWDDDDEDDDDEDDGKE